MLRGNEKEGRRNSQSEKKIVEEQRYANVRIVETHIGIDIHALVRNVEESRMWTFDRIRNGARETIRFRRITYT